MECTFVAIQCGKSPSCSLFLGLLFAVTVGWWAFLTLTVSVVFGNVAAAVFAVCSAFSVIVGYGLVRASDSRE